MTEATAIHDLVINAGQMIVGGGEPPVKDVVVTVDNGVITSIGSASANGRTVIDVPDSVLMPGLVDPHTHVASNMLLRGLLDDLLGTDQFTWLERMWLMKEKVDHETLYWASLAGLVEMAKAGITCFNEHFDGYAVRPQARALQTLPLRATLGFGLADGAQTGMYGALGEWSKWALSDWDAAIDGVEHDGDRVRLALSPHAPYSTSRWIWEDVRDLAAERGLTVHTHVAEGMREVQYMQETYGTDSTVRWLDDMDFLGGHVTAAHCSMTDAADRKVLAAHDVKVAHCPISNARGASGRMDLRAMWEAGVTVGLATDGPAGHNTLDMFQEMKFAAVTHKQATADPTFLTTRQVIDLATRDAAAAMHRPELGRLAAGAPADLIVVSLSGAHVQPVYDVESTLVYATRADDVTHTIVGGNVLVADRRVVGLDEREVVARFRESAHRLRARALG
ncbi:amidohydrolase family protein [Streptomyces sp. SID6673]|nr:amidohydrolase family protein [Streptomyces sp. SID11726]NEB26604.1 amidohydrolase family protein [Streptomyces sp. SID6673]